MRTRWIAALGLLVLTAGGWAVGRLQEGFDHKKHEKLFPLCTTCHAGAETAGAPLWPTAVSCASCHDGEIQPAADWAPPTATKPSNLRFAHARHVEASAKRPEGRKPADNCSDCHVTEGEKRMAVHRAEQAQCFACHTDLPAEHLAVSDSACAACHLTLAQATTLPGERVAAFPVPPSHRMDGFMARGGHGKAAGAGGGVAASCATCHAREFCITCHVDAPEQPAIQALAMDTRSLLHVSQLRPPPSHAAGGFVDRHGQAAERTGATCATCHTRESCTACHMGRAPRAVQALAAAGPGRAPGPSLTRKTPASHVSSWARDHGPEAAASPTRCASCHTRDECLSCHRPDPVGGAGTSGFHPSGFLARHPTEAYRREISCADCHQTGQFCSSCHQQAGLTSRALLGGTRYHDAKQFFIAGHGQAARQSLENCVGCHVERDCLTCHASVGGRRFSPHGPGFDADRLRRRNPEMCSACHGTAIPGG